LIGRLDPEFVGTTKISGPGMEKHGLSEMIAQTAA
jgi:hypothetical protein